jgi:hypothetical protein
MVRIKRGDDHFPDLAVGDRVPGARSHDLDQDVLADDHSRARAALVRDDT